MVPVHEITAVTYKANKYNNCDIPTTAQTSLTPFARAARMGLFCHGGKNYLTNQIIDSGLAFRSPPRAPLRSTHELSLIHI